jgi:hypothetical protein
MIVTSTIDYESKEGPGMKITTVGGVVVVEFLANLPKCRVGMEACASAHY